MSIGVNSAGVVSAVEHSEDVKSCAEVRNCSGECTVEAFSLGTGIVVGPGGSVSLSESPPVPIGPIMFGETRCRDLVINVALVPCKFNAVPDFEVPEIC